MDEDQNLKFEIFIRQAILTRKLWLLQADEGQFALLGDDVGRSFIPVWSSMEQAKLASQAEWGGYTVTEMGLGEFISWMDELQVDEILIGMDPDENRKILALEAAAMKEVLQNRSQTDYNSN
jgi:hypothetical protein